MGGGGGFCQISFVLFFTDDYMGYLIYYSAFILWFDHFLDSGTEICQNFWKILKDKKDILKLTDLWYTTYYGAAQ